MMFTFEEINTYLENAYITYGRNNKISQIEYVRSYTGLSLSTARYLVELYIKTSVLNLNKPSYRTQIESILNSGGHELVVENDTAPCLGDILKEAIEKRSENTKKHIVMRNGVSYEADTREEAERVLAFAKAAGLCNFKIYSEV